MCKSFSRLGRNSVSFARPWGTLTNLVPTMDNVYFQPPLQVQHYSTSCMEEEIGVTSPSLLSQNQYALRNGPLEIRYGRALHAPVLRARQTLCVQCLLPLSLLQQVFIIGGKKSVNKRINTKRMRTTISGLLTLRSSLFSTAIFPPSILMF